MRILAALAAVLVLAPAASAATTPGWKQLIVDSRDGRIDGVYRCSTYRTALRHLPPGAGDELERRLESGRCVASTVAAPKAEGRNWVAQGVATVLGIVAVVLVVRRRRQLQR